MPSPDHIARQRQFFNLYFVFVDHATKASSYAGFGGSRYRTPTKTF